MKRIAITITSLILLSFLLPGIQFPIVKSNFTLVDTAYAAPFSMKVSQHTYSPRDTLIVYGEALANDTLLITLHDPSGTQIRLDSVKADPRGFFFTEFLVWPEPSRNLAFGLYTVKMISNTDSVNRQEVQISFSDRDTPVAGISPVLGVKLDSPISVRTSSSFRIFIQVTFDGALVNSDPAELLGSSHAHSGDQTVVLAGKFFKLHEGIYYADVELPKDGAYIIHAVAFYRGLLSHDSKVVTASATTIGTIQESVDRLNSELEDANSQLEQLQQELNQTEATLQSTESTIRTAVENAREEISGSVSDVAQASGQINSLIIPILALISVIVALQISLFARIRASYR